MIETMIEITKKQEYVNDVAGEIKWTVIAKREYPLSHEYMHLNDAYILALRDALNNLKLEGDAPILVAGSGGSRNGRP